MLSQYIVGIGLSLIAAGSRIAEVCSFREAPGTPRIGTIEHVRDLVRRADLIVRARAVGYGQGEHYLIPPAVVGLGEGRAVEFEVLEALTPGSAPKRLYIGGHLTTTDDFNRGPVPYLYVRSEGQRGTCVASAYRRGGEYLLLLKRAPQGYHTPYWAWVSPTNEQIRGRTDPWVVWVRAQLAAHGRATPTVPAPGA